MKSWSTQVTGRKKSIKIIETENGAKIKIILSGLLKDVVSIEKEL